MPGSMGPPQPLHLLTVWAGSRGNWIALGLRPLCCRGWKDLYQGSLCSWPLTCGISWQIWGARTDPAPPDQELCGAGKGPAGSSLALLGPWLLVQKGKGAGNTPGRSSKWSPEVALVLLVETKLRRAAHCI